jgi:hypothetical protein
MQVEKEETVFYAAIKWLQARLHTRHNSLRRTTYFVHYSSVADPGCLSRILDPNFSHPGSEFFLSLIPDPHQFKYFNPNKMVSKLSEI